MFNHKQVIIDAFKHWELIVVTDGSEDLPIHCLKLNQYCTAGLHRLKGLYYEVLQERWDPSETSDYQSLFKKEPALVDWT